MWGKECLFSRKIIWSRGVRTKMKKCPPAGTSTSYEDLISQSSGLGRNRDFSGIAAATAEVRAILVHTVPSPKEARKTPWRLFKDWGQTAPKSRPLLGDSFCNPNPHIQGKNMNTNMAPKLPNLPCFGVFGVILCPDFCSYFCLVCGGRGSLAYFWLQVSLHAMHLLSWQALSQPINTLPPSLPGGGSHLKWEA